MITADARPSIRHICCLREPQIGIFTVDNERPQHIVILTS